MPSGEDWQDADLAWFERLLDEDDVDVMAWALGTAGTGRIYRAADGTHAKTRLREYPALTGTQRPFFRQAETMPDLIPHSAGR